MRSFVRLAHPCATRKNALFETRTAAGFALVDLLERYSKERPMVFGLGKGGAMVAAALARALGAPLDLLPVQAFALPCDQQTILGAVAPGGACVLDDQLVDLLDVESDAIGALRSQAVGALAQQGLLLRGGRPLPVVKGRTVILVDDVITSPLKARAACLYLHQEEARNTIVAAPVISRSALQGLRPLVHALVALEEVERVPELGRIYVNAADPGDVEVRRALGVNAPTDNALSRSAMDER